MVNDNFESVVSWQEAQGLLELVFLFPLIWYHFKPNSKNPSKLDSWSIIC